jgi:hypothetical protein
MSTPPAGAENTGARHCVATYPSLPVGTVQINITSAAYVLRAVVPICPSKITIFEGGDSAPRQCPCASIATPTYRPVNTAG